MNYEAVIGLEIHVELGTQTKLFCGCSNHFGQSPNSQVCPVCLGLPGVLPVVNQRAVELILFSGLALECKIPPRSKFDRKNYFYPDMPKNYQISQYDLPFTQNGHLVVESNGTTRKIGITRIHLEEDTGKSIHGGQIGSSTHTLLDYNRAGVPLIEVVTEPDLRSAEEAVDFLQKLRRTLQFLNVSDCKMEEGRMRCDANVSLRPLGDKAYGVKIEVKNMNSFKSVKDALTHEIDRQTRVLSSNGKLTQETRGWDETKRITFSMRSKEEAHDYRYFPEPDLPPFQVSNDLLESLRATLPELPQAKSARYQREYSLSSEDAEFLVSTRSMSEFFESALQRVNAPKEICNWLRGDVAKILNEHGIEIEGTRLTPAALSKLILMTRAGTVSGKIGKELLPEMIVRGEDPEALVAAKGLTQISDPESLKGMISEVLGDPASAKAIEEFRSGKERALGFLVGAVMKKTAGKANPQLVNELLKGFLSKN